jgi:hypothetical protein
MRARALAAPAAVAALTATALALRLWPFTEHRYGAYGNDEMVYFSAGAALLRGDLPYADYVFVHPPGIALLLAPFAAFGPGGFVAAKSAIAAAGAANVVLVAVAAWRWTGAVAGVVAAAVYATIAPSVLAGRTILLEPVLNGLVLGAGLLLVPPAGTPSRRRVALAGVLVALACLVKAWGAVYLVAGVVALAPARRAVLAFAGGFAAAAALLAAPWLLTGPGRVVHQVAGLQLDRPVVDTPLAERVTGALPLLPWLDASGAAALAIATVVGVAAAWALRTQGRAGRLWATACVAGILTFAVFPTFIAHYGDFTSAPGAIVVGAAAGAAWRRVRVGARAVAVSCAAIAVAVPATLLVESSRLRVFPGIDLVGDFRAVAARELAGGDCAVADSNGFAALVPRPPVYALFGGPLVDDRAAGHERGGRGSEEDLFAHAEPRDVAELRAATSRCRFVALVVPPHEHAWTAEMRAWFAAEFELRATGTSGWTLWERRGRTLSAARQRA